MVQVVLNVVFILALPLLVSSWGGKIPYEVGGDDEDDSLDCNDGRKIDDPALLPFYERFRGREMMPSWMKEWIIYFDESEGLGGLGESWNEAFLTEMGFTAADRGLLFGRILYREGMNVYFPRVKFIGDEQKEFRVMYAEQLLLESMEQVKIYVKYEATLADRAPLSRSAVRMLQKLLTRSNVSEVYVVTTSECDFECREVPGNPLMELASCGSVFGVNVAVRCVPPGGDMFRGSKAAAYRDGFTPEFQVDLPTYFKRELHKITDWLFSRIAQRMKNYMEMAFAKNLFQKSSTDLYNKVNLLVSKIRGGQSFEASKSAQLIYNSLFDLNVYLNVTNTPFTFDKLAFFNSYLQFIGKFSNWQLDAAKYANFFEPLKDICLGSTASGSSGSKPSTKVFELEEGVHDFTRTICHENVLYIIGTFTTLATVKSCIYDNRRCRFDTVFVLATKNFTIAEDIRIRGKNLVIFSPSWTAVRNHEIDLSGNEGKVGHRGARGGDFFAFGSRFEGSNRLTVVSNGGDGGTGRKSGFVTDQSLIEMVGGECVPKNKRALLERYGASRGAPGGLPGGVTLKFIRNPRPGVTLIRRKGLRGKDAVLENINILCGLKNTSFPVPFLLNGKFKTRNRQRMSETEILELFRKIIRKNSRRLPYEALGFYKDIWTSPIMGQTLGSTLTDFLNESDHSSDSREFYDITSQILHAQIKSDCRLTKTQQILFDFALVTILMEKPVEGALISVIDIDGYLKTTADALRKHDAGSSYFRRKISMFSAVIVEANDYLRISLLPSLWETISGMHNYLREQQMRYESLAGFEDSPDDFQESLAMNSLLRQLAILFEHVQITLSDFVAPPEESAFGELNHEWLKKKLYLFRHIRNNMTASEMSAMRELLHLMSKGNDGEVPPIGILCHDCREEARKLLKELKVSGPKTRDCEKLAMILRPLSLRGSPEPSDLSEMICRTCEDCNSCGWCKSCVAQCVDCVNHTACPWCVECHEPRSAEFPHGKYFLCSECDNCSTCPECPQCPKVAEDGSSRFSSDDEPHERYPCVDCPKRPKCKLRGGFDGIDHSAFSSQRGGDELVKTMGTEETKTDVPDGSHRGREEAAQMPTDSPGDALVTAETEASDGFPESAAQATRWNNCLNMVGFNLDRMFERNGTCNLKTQRSCFIALTFLRKMSERGEGNADRSEDLTGRLNRSRCRSIINHFVRKLSAEVNKCSNDGVFNYHSTTENRSLCSPKNDVLFRISGCEPETFSRTYDQIRDSFLKQFLRFASDQHSDEMDEVSMNYVHALTTVDLLLTEQLPVTSNTVNGILVVSDALLTFSNLKADYEKRVTQLHDFSQTDVYDLLTAEQSMQNERLDLTSKWLGQMKKLVPWIRKVTTFLAGNDKFRKVSEKISEAVRLVSEIVHNIKVVEHYRNLDEYKTGIRKMDETLAQDVAKFKAIFRRTFANDMFNKAIKIVENWMFPMTKSVWELRDTLRNMKHRSHGSRLKAAAKAVDRHRKSISLHTSNQYLDWSRGKSLLYRWNVRTRPTLMDDLFASKPVILVSEILDGGELNALTAKNFEMKLVAVEGAQGVVDEALHGSCFTVTHSGISYFKFGSRIYRRLTETLTFRQPAAPFNRTVPPQDTNFVLSPYTTWILLWESRRPVPTAIREKISGIELYGTGRYVVNCAEMADVNQHFSPLADYQRRNGK